MTAQPPKYPKLKPDEQAVFQLLMDNIHLLKCPLPGGGTHWVKHPYFQERLSGNPDGVRRVKEVFCRGITQLLKDADVLKPPDA